MTRTDLITALLGALLLLATPGAAQRLPGTVVPDHYDLTFAPDFDKDNFQGQARIDVRVLEPTSSITVNAAEIDFKQVDVVSGNERMPAKVTLDPEKETATFTVNGTIPRGTVSLDIKFVGQLNDKLRGFYLSKANGREYAVTQLEATDGRRAFPSFDEPAFKSTFDVTLIVDRGDTAISNGAVISDTPGPGTGKHTLKFARTPKMSSYLVAMIVGNFECREGNSDGIPVRICSTPDKLALTGFALEAAEYQLKFYNDYYGIKYPFGKLDLIAVPDFAAGAMENTGAITFREVLLLADPQTATLAARKNIAGVISHEIAHQWFGNLVTMKWWDDLWLNEGFATWMANKPLQRWKPEWQSELDDAADNQTALNVDALRTTRPIKAKMETPAEISGAFDAIAYQKGAAVLRMIESFVGEETFRTGVASYLRRYSYSNATSENFWTEIAAASGKPVNEIMKGFVEQPGEPLLTVSSRCDGQNTAVTLTQQRFYLDPSLIKATGDPLWQIPVCMKTAGSAAPTCAVMTDKQQTFSVPGCGSWAFVNAGAKGYYRSEYPAANVDALASVVATALTPAERISLMEDEWALVRTGRHAIAQFLTLAAGLAQDPKAQIMSSLAARLGFVGGYLATDATRPAFQSWVRRTFEPVVKSLGWEPRPGEDDTTRALRATALVIVGGIGRDPEILREVRQRAEKYLTDPSSLDPTLSVAVLSLAADTGDAALYDKFLAKAKAATSPQEYYRFLQRLADFNDPALVTRTLEYALSKDVRTQDAPQIIAALMNDAASRPQAWTFIKSRWSTIEQSLGTFQGIPAIVSATGAFCDPTARQDVEAFFKAHPVPAADRAMQQALEAIANCSGVRQRQEKELAAFLAEPLARLQLC